MAVMSTNLPFSGVFHSAANPLSVGATDLSLDATLRTFPNYLKHQLLTSNSAFNRNASKEIPAFGARPSLVHDLQLQTAQAAKQIVVQS
jgi:hypothetical protein